MQASEIKKCHVAELGYLLRFCEKQNGGRSGLQGDLRLWAVNPAVRGRASPKQAAAFVPGSRLRQNWSMWGFHASAVYLGEPSMLRFGIACMLVGMAAVAAAGEKPPLKVFVLAGQSNMQGHAQVRTFPHLAMDPATVPLLARMQDADGSPHVCDRVWISSIGSSDEEQTGRLTAGFGAANAGPKIGPEFTFGLTVEQLVEGPVLIIKTAWGGKSLNTDFRSPSAGPYVFSEAQLASLQTNGKDIEAIQEEKRQATGVFYRQMIDHVRSVLADLPRVVPDYEPEQGYELSGFVWFQGWNDMVDGSTYPHRDQPGGYDAYSDCMACFIRDVRKDLNTPELPFVIGVLGVGGPVAEYGPDQQRYATVHTNFREAMAAPAALQEFAGTVTAVRTEAYWDRELSEAKAKENEARSQAKKMAKEESLAPDEEQQRFEKLRGELLSLREKEVLEVGISNLEFHYLGSAKILGRIGEAFAKAVVELREGQRGGDEGEPAGDRLSTATAAEIFQSRILPIMHADKPSSCVECHLSGVDLADYIRPSQAETFAALRSAGLINEQDPDASKILTFINRRPDRPNLISEATRAGELAAFRAWIHAAVEDPALLASKDAQAIGPQLSLELIRHARQDRVLASFLDNIWTEVGRCAACHSPDQNKKQVAEHGERVSWIVLNDPQATLSHMLDADIIDPAQPLESLLLTKPTLQVEHGGGQKMVVGDRTYKQFRRFIDDYAKVASGAYASVHDLPRESDEVSVVTDIWLKFTDVPEAFDKMLLQVDLYRWEGDQWSDHRVATSDRPVFGGGKLWQHSLSLIAPRGSAWASQLDEQELPPGKYLAKLYVDQEHTLARDFTWELGERELIGVCEFNSAWPAGYGSMTIVPCPIASASRP
jgi:hypothetical protein